jgi:hypothetical protein
MTDDFITHGGLLRVDRSDFTRGEGLTVTERVRRPLLLELTRLGWDTGPYLSGSRR